MNLRYLLPLVAMALLPSCDQVKDKLIDVIAESVPESSGSAGPQKQIRHLTEADYEAFTQTKGHVVIVDFYADWCGPCRQLTPVLEKVVADLGGVALLGKVDVDQNKAIAQQAGVRGIPDVRIFKDGKQVDRFVGSMPESMVKARVSAHLDGLAPSPKPAPGASKPTAAGAAAVVEEKQPTVMPMTKDWLPSGIQRK